MQKSEVTVGMKVSFMRDRRVMNSTVVRANPKRARVLAEDGREYYVPYPLLSEAQESATTGAPAVMPNFTSPDPNRAFLPMPNIAHIRFTDKGASVEVRDGETYQVPRSAFDGTSTGALVAIAFLGGPCPEETTIIHEGSDTVTVGFRTEGDMIRDAFARGARF